MSIILGIDPGSRITGYGIIRVLANQRVYLTSGCLHTTVKDMSQRLQEIYQGITTLIQEYQPNAVAIEKVFVKRNVAAALKLGQARGAAMTAVAQLALPVSEYSPRQVKQAIVGYGGADKTQVQYMIKCLLNLSALPKADAADALAIALCHANTMNWAKLSQQTVTLN